MQARIDTRESQKVRISEWPNCAVSRSDPESVCRVRKTEPLLNKTSQPVMEYQRRLYGGFRRKNWRGMHGRSEKTHEVTPEYAVQWLERGHGFLEYLGKYKIRMIFTMNETCVTLDDFSGERDIYYQRKEGVAPPNWGMKS